MATYTKINTGIISLPEFNKSILQTRPLGYDVTTVQDFEDVVRRASEVVIEWTLGKLYPVLYWTIGPRWHPMKMDPLLPFTLLQAGRIEACQTGEVSKWRVKSHDPQR